jgi:ribonuclease P protein component
VAEVSTIRRLKTRRQFLAAAKGASASRGAVVVQALARADGEEAVGVGFTATRRIGGAVVRNRAKRRLREAARRLVPLHATPGSDYVFIARAGTAKRPWARLLDDVESALISLAANPVPGSPAAADR